MKKHLRFAELCISYAASGSAAINVSVNPYMVTHVTETEHHVLLHINGARFGDTINIAKYDGALIVADRKMIVSALEAATKEYDSDDG